MNRKPCPGRMQRARDLGANATRGTGDKDDGSRRGSHHGLSIAASTCAAAAKPKLAVTATEEP